MIISRTPFRISFFGGGTDYPVWYQQEGGAVLTCAIDKYCYITGRYLPPFFSEHKTRIVYSKIESVMSNDQIEHRAVRAALKFLKISEGVEIHHDGDLPARSGIGSSSSFTVGLLNTLHAMKHRMMSKMELAEQAIHVERHILKEAVGSQDQAIAAFGGLNKILFNRNDKILIEPVILPPEKIIGFQDHLLLYFTGFSRFAFEIAKEQIRESKNHTKELRQMKGMVDEGLAILTGPRSLDGFGKLLHEAWKLKRGLSHRITTPEIDAMYAAGIRAGASGGKLLGAGGGGFMLFFVRPEKQKRFKEKMKKLLEIPFRFDYAGSQIIFYNHQKNLYGK